LLDINNEKFIFCAKEISSTYGVQTFGFGWAGENLKSYVSSVTLTEIFIGSFSFYKNVGFNPYKGK
jgi:hypothetical protein